MSENSTLQYMHQDHLTGTSLMTDADGDQIDTTMKYYPYGGTRAGDVPVDKLFTGQRLDGTGLYYYGARYYDPTIGRFISPDTIVPDPASPQSFNRYSYCLNNPLKYTDPSGQTVYIEGINVLDIPNALNYYDPRWFASIKETNKDTYFLKEYKAYNELRGIAQELIQVLEDSDRIIKIVENDIDANAQSIGGLIEISPSRLKDVKDAAASMAHEFFHQLVDIRGVDDNNSRYEEACAWSYHAAVDKALGKGFPNDTSVFIDHMIPSMSDAEVDRFLRQWYWGAFHPDYAILALYPGGGGGYFKMKNLYVQYYPEKSNK